jgi:hypothetical protein
MVHLFKRAWLTLNIAHAGARFLQQTRLKHLTSPPNSGPLNILSVQCILTLLTQIAIHACQLHPMAAPLSDYQNIGHLTRIQSSLTHTIQIPQPRLCIITDTVDLPTARDVKSIVSLIKHSVRSNEEAKTKSYFSIGPHFSFVPLIRFVFD